ncbi:MAG: S-layer homology domain-containing protein [Oscillospiraceae bacterium]|nr:S-layer homology domain-containing protein [Oscillospiraceae bacterium]
MKRCFTKPLSLLLALALALALSPGAFGQSSGVTLTVDPPGPINLIVGESVTLTAHVSPEGTQVYWNTTYGNVDIEDRGDGTAVVTANNATTATNPVRITVTTDAGDGPTQTVLIHIASLNLVRSVSIRPTSPSVTVGETVQLYADLTPANPASDPSYPTVKWKSMNTAIATVDEDTGLVHGIHPGTVEITATAVDSNHAMGSCLLTVTNESTVSSVRFNTTNVSIAEGDTYTGLYATVTMDDGTVYRTDLDGSASEVTWSPSESGVVSVDENGKITGTGTGKITLTASRDSKSDTCTVTVSGMELKRGSSNLTAITLYENESQEFTIVPHQDAEKVISWNVVPEIPGIAEVSGADTDRIITGVKAGSTTIVCTGYLTVEDVTVNSGSQSRVITFTESFTVTVLPIRFRSTTISTGMTLPFTYVTDRINTLSQRINGSRLSYLTGLSVSTSEGTLYYNYVAESDTGGGVATLDRYYLGNAGDQQLDRVSFVPRSGFTGTATITYTAYSTNGVYFRGDFEVPVQQGTANGAIIAYTAIDGAPVQFEAEDFNMQSQAINNRQITYVNFSLPSSTQGSLQYNRLDESMFEGAVSATTKYYRSSAPGIDNVWFVPRSGFSGMVTINFTGVDAAGVSLQGIIRINVTGPNVISGREIRYTLDRGQRVYLNPSDFSNASYNATTAQLNYIILNSLPSSNAGVMYYGSGTNNRANTGTSYYLGAYASGYGSPRYIGDLCFSANSDYSGSFSIPFTGYNTNGTSFTGSIYFTVGTGSTGGNGGNVSYTVRSGETLGLRASDFSDASYSAIGMDFDYVYFNSLPSSAQGTMYFNGVTVGSTSGAYYRTGSTRLLDYVSFISATGYTGAVSLPFTSYSASGSSYNGTLTINVGSSASSSQGNVFGGSGNVSSSGNISYYSNGSPVHFSSSDFSSALAGRLSGSISTVRFTTPLATVGRLCLNYTSPTRYTMSVSDTDYSFSAISQMVFLPHAGFQGVAQIPFTARNSAGTNYNGTVTIQVTPPVSSSRFGDMAGFSWAIPAVEFLSSSNIISGTGGTTYSPGSNMRRSDFVLMLSRAFVFGTYGYYDSFMDVPEDAYYASAVAAAKSAGLVYGDKYGNFNPDGTISRQDASVILYRCLRYSGNMPTGSNDDLMYFTDRGLVSDYAIEAMGSLVRLGVLQGSNGYLNPLGLLTRAEMAVIFYRAIT